MKNIKILQSNKVCKNFYVVLFFVKQWEQNNLLEYKDRALMSMPLMEKRGYFHRISIFPHPISIWCRSKHTIGHLVKKKCNMLVHIHQLLYVQERNGEGENERIEKLYCSSQDVVEPNCGFLIENVFLVWSNRILE